RTRMATPRARSSSSQTAIRALFEASARAREVFLEENGEALARAVDLVAEALAGGRKLLLFGNGGSAADAQHLAAEFVGRFEHARGAHPGDAHPDRARALRARRSPPVRGVVGETPAASEPRPPPARRVARAHRAARPAVQPGGRSEPRAPGAGGDDGARAHRPLAGHPRRAR